MNESGSSGVVDKWSVMHNISQSNPISVLELGIGDLKRKPNSIGVDIIDGPAVDIVGDIIGVLRMLPDDCVCSIFSEHVFEHLADLTQTMNEVARVLIPGGTLEIVVPHFSNPFYYSDPTHRNFFGLYTFSYFCSDELFRRRVPSYVRNSELKLKAVNLIFKTFPPRYMTYVWRKVIQIIFNLTNYTKEVYEDSFSRFVSCYEVEFHIVKRVIKKS